MFALFTAPQAWFQITITADSPSSNSDRPDDIWSRGSSEIWRSAFDYKLVRSSETPREVGYRCFHNFWSCSKTQIAIVKTWSYTQIGFSGSVAHNLVFCFFRSEERRSSSFSTCETPVELTNHQRNFLLKSTLTTIPKFILDSLFQRPRNSVTRTTVEFSSGRLHPDSFSFGLSSDSTDVASLDWSAFSFLRPVSSFWRWMFCVS